MNVPPLKVWVTVALTVAAIALLPTIVEGIASWLLPTHPPFQK